MSEFHREPLRLNYASQVRHQSSEWQAAVELTLGIFAGLFGTLMLFVGVGGVGIHIAGNLAELSGMVTLLKTMALGVLALFLSVRWIRRALEHPNDRK